MEEELGFTQTQGEADPGELATILRRVGCRKSGNAVTAWHLLQS